MNWQAPADPGDEAERLLQLQALGILDTPPDPLLDEIVRLVASACGAPIALVSLVDSDRQWFKASCGLTVRETERSISFCGHAILQDALFEVEDTLADPRFRENPLVVGPPGIRHYAGMPITVSTGARVGTLCVIDNRPGRLTDGQREMLACLARIVGTLIEQYRERDISAERMARLDALLENMPMAAVACNQAGQLDHFNRLARDWHGLDATRIPQEEWARHFSLFEADGDRLLTADRIPLLRAFHGEDVVGDEIVIKAVGQPPRQVACFAHPILDTEGRALGALALMDDVSELRRTHDALLSERRDLQTMLDGTQAGTWRWNIRTGELVVNERWAGMIGYAPSDLAPASISTWRRQIHPEDIAQFDAALEAYFDGRTPYFDCTVRLLHRSGLPIWAQERGQLFARDEDGRPLWMAGTRLDISPLKQAELDLTQSKAELQAVIDASQDVALIATTPEGVIRVFNRGAERLLGFDAAELVGRETPAAFHLREEVEARGEELSAIHGIPIRGFDVFVHAARRGEAETRNWTYVCKDGSHRDVRLSVSPIHDRTGGISGFLGVAIDQTEQRRAEREARLQAEQFRGAFDAVPVGMALVDLDGHWKAVNDALCHKLGYSRDELLALDFQALTHPDDLDADLDNVNKLLAGEIDAYRMVKRYFRKSGELIWAQLSVSLIRDDAGAPLHFVSQILNITAERQARQSLEASEGRLRGLFEMSPVGILLVAGHDGRIIDANNALAEQTGIAVSRLRTLTLQDIQLPLDPAVQDRIDAELTASGRSSPYESSFRRNDDSTFPVRIQAALVHELDGRAVIWHLVEDVSEQRRVERLKTEFVSTVSHELRTPLTSIVGALGLLRSGALGPIDGPARDLLGIAADNSRRLTQLVNDLLDMEKLVAGKITFQLQPLQVAPFAKKVADGLRDFAAPLGVEIEVCDDLAGEVMADEQRLEQVLVNLLSNACKHSPRGSRVTLCGEILPGGDIVIDVIDQGTGIPAEFRSRIFEKFAQADQGDTRARGGTGLGLAICRELMQGMGGTIGFESQEGSGSHFWIRLPAHRRARDTHDPEAKACVLLVEDDPAIIAMATTQLRDIARLDIATGVREAMAAVRRCHYDIVVLDLMLPDGHGKDLWEAVHRAQPDIAFIVLSGYEVPRALASSAQAIVTKGEHAPSMLRQAVARVLGSSHSSRPPDGGAAAALH